MFRVAKPGGRFTISDIVADRPVPQYLVHDAEKWGNCLSGALTLTDYIAGIVGAGFPGHSSDQGLALAGDRRHSLLLRHVDGI